MQQHLLDVVNEPWYKEHSRSIIGLSVITLLALIAIVVIYGRNKKGKINK